MIYILTQKLLVKLQYEVKEDWKNGNTGEKTRQIEMHPMLCRCPL